MDSHQLEDVDTWLSASIGKQIKKLFKKYDVDSGERVSKDECRKILEDLYLHSGTKVPKSALLDRWLTDQFDLASVPHDRRVTKEEFAGLLVKSKLWESLEKKAHKKALRFSAKDERTYPQMKCVYEEVGFNQKIDVGIDPLELADAYKDLKKALDKPWKPKQMESMAEHKLAQRGSKDNIREPEWNELCLSGVLRLDFKTGWWAKSKGSKAREVSNTSGGRSRSDAGSEDEETDEEGDRNANSSRSVETLSRSRRSEGVGIARVNRAGMNWSRDEMSIEYRTDEGQTRFRRFHLRKCFDNTEDTAAVLECMKGDARNSSLIEAVGEEQLLRWIGFLLDKKSTPLRADQLVSMDLGKLGDEELADAKKVMDVEFYKNQLQPGDPGFQRDIKQEYHPTEASEWDD